MRKRSKYKPKGVRMDCMLYVTSGMKRVGQVKDAGVMLKLKNHQALAAIVKGVATRDDVDILIAALNVTEALYCVNPKLGADWSSEVRVAQDAVVVMARRGVSREDRFVFTGTELQAVNTAMDVHDVQLDQATVAELEKALQFVEQEVKHKRARAVIERATV